MSEVWHRKKYFSLHATTAYEHGPGSLQDLCITASAILIFLHFGGGKCDEGRTPSPPSSIPPKKEMRGKKYMFEGCIF